MSGRKRNGAPATGRTKAVLLVATTILLICIYSFSWSTLASSSQQAVVALTTGAHGNVPFPKKVVHLDLKGAPTKVAYYEWFFPFLRGLGVDGLLVEYEDTFPYNGTLAELSRTRGGYSFDDVARLTKLAELNGLEVIPLVQTFGHMEFALKHAKFSKLRENVLEDDSICISEPESMQLIKEMVSQIKKLHPHSRRIHIGADEAYHVGEDSRCERELSTLGERPRSLEMLKIRHISRVAKMCKGLGFEEIFAWNDMFATAQVEDMKAVELGQLITPVVWGYAVDVLKKDYFPQGLFHRLRKVFDKVWFASAFKGANGKEQAFMSVERYLQNHRSYVELYRSFDKDLDGIVQGIMMTGWQRYKHRLPLCELLPVAVPSIVINSVYLANVLRPSSEMNTAAKMYLNCTRSASRIPVFEPITVGNLTYFPQKDNYFSDCPFHDQSLYKLIMSDLRLLTWKVQHFAFDIRQRRDLETGIKTLEPQLKEALSEYYAPGDVNEIMEQYVGSLKKQLP